MKANCPCGRIVDYASCCGRLHAGLPAPDAEALMRSRYAAYTLGNIDYLLQTWHASTRPAADTLAPPSDARMVWLGLDVVARKVTSPEHATVEFIARFRIGGGSAQRQHELSRFVREDGRWYYVDGDMLDRQALRSRVSARR